MRKPKPPEAISVFFTPRIRADGKLIRVRIKQGDAEIHLTKEQAQSLVGQLQPRIERMIG